MHQDQRIGLALAVLLLGAAGAFFFRNEARPVTGSPQLRSVKKLDDRIAEKSITPYMQGIEIEESQSGTKARTVSDRGGSGLSQGSDDSLPQLGSPDFLTTDSGDPFDASGNRTQSEQRVRHNDDGVPDLAPILVPDSDEIATREQPSPRKNASATEAERFHVVQKGESLSSIAAKELGSSNRFIELFEANRHLLKNPNDVQVGMKLRVPARHISRATEAPRTRSQIDLLRDSAPPLLDPKRSKLEEAELPPIVIGPDGNSATSPMPGESSSEPKRFVTPKRLPLGARVPGLQSDASSVPSQAGRRLSQLPPDENGGKSAR